jgi:hypothetical protein
MAENIDSKILISLVQARPVLWDKILEIFKDRMNPGKPDKKFALSSKMILKNLEIKTKCIWRVL